jgi:hypothetical protein
VLAIVVGLLLLVRAVRERRVKKDRVLLTTCYMLLVGWFAAYMTHLKSIWIYQLIPQLSYIQFPWRFLTITIFAFSFVVGYLPGLIAKMKAKHGFFVKLIITPPQLIVTFVLILILVSMNWRYFRVERTGPVTDKEKFSGEAWRIQQTAGIYDYLPIYAKTAPKSTPSAPVELIEGDGLVSGMGQGTYYTKFNANVESETAKVRVSTLYFPGWRAFIKENSNIKELDIYIPEEEEWGRMWIDLPQGEHEVLLQLFNTPVRTYSNILSILSFAVLFSYPVWKNRVQFRRGRD